MANTSRPAGFLPCRSDGVQTTRRRRPIEAGGGSTALAPGDYYDINAAGSAVRITGSGVSTVGCGIVEAIELATRSGPVSYESVPASTTPTPPATFIYLIGIEDKNVEFEVQIHGATGFTAGDEGKTIDVYDTAPDTTLLNKSNQEVDDTTIGAGTQFVIVRLIDRPDNEAGVNAKIAVKSLLAI